MFNKGVYKVYLITKRVLSGGGSRGEVLKPKTAKYKLLKLKPLNKIFLDSFEIEKNKIDICLHYWKILKIQNPNKTPSRPKNAK